MKALNTVGAPVMVDPSSVPGEHTIFVAGDDASAKEQVVELLTSIGWPRDRVLDLGGIAASRGLEMYPAALAFALLAEWLPGAEHRGSTRRLTTPFARAETKIGVRWPAVTEDQEERLAKNESLFRTLNENTSEVWRAGCEARSRSSSSANARRAAASSDSR